MNTGLSPINAVGSSWANTLLDQLQTVSPLPLSMTTPNVALEPTSSRSVGIVGRTFGSMASGLGRAFMPIAFAAGALLLAACPASMSYWNIEYPDNGKKGNGKKDNGMKWVGQIVDRSPCTDKRSPPARALLQMLRRTCFGKIDHDVVRIRRCGPCSWEWNVELSCNSGGDPFD
jgi:hypothetical protein